MRIELPNPHTNQQKIIDSKARELYNNKEVPQEVNQYNQRKWIRSVLKLGDKWLLAKNVQRIQ